MAEAVMTAKGREKLCKALAGDIELPKLKYVAYGDGGTDADGTPYAVTGEEVGLRNELLRMELDGHEYPIPTTCAYKSGLSKEDLANMYISELGYFDEEETLIVYKTFLPKGKDDDMSFDFTIESIF